MICTKNVMVSLESEIKNLTQPHISNKHDQYLPQYSFLITAIIQ